MNYQLSNKYPQKRAFITGAASGLGLAICTELAKDGWTIGMSDIDFDSLLEAAKKIESAGGKTHLYQLNVADKEEYENVSRTFLDEVGGIDLLINNAGVGDAGYVGEYSLENWEWILGINLFGVINGCHFFAPVFKEQRSGTLINIASAAAFSSLPKMSAYNVGKAGVLSLSETIDGELHPFNVNVSVVMPTFFKTNVMQYSRGDKKHIELSRLIFATTPLTPDKVAQEILKKSGRGKFHIILPANARVMYWLKRHFPKLVLYIFRWTERNKEKVETRLSKKYEKMDKKGQVDHDYLEGAFTEKKANSSD